MGRGGEKGRPDPVGVRDERREEVRETNVPEGGHSLLKKQGTKERDKEKAEIKVTGVQDRPWRSLPVSLLSLVGLTDVAMAMALAFLAASSRPGSVSLTSAAADPHHGGGPRLRRLNRGLPRGWRRRKKTHKTPQMGGSLAGQEEEQGGPGRRCGTSSKGARSAPSPRPLGGCRVGQAPELPVLGLGGTLGPHGPKAPFQCQDGRGGGSWGCARRLFGPLRTALGAGRSRRGGRAGPTSLGANLSHPEPRRRAVLPGLRSGRRGLCSSPAAREGAGVVKIEKFVSLQSRPTWQRRPGWSQRPRRVGRLGWTTPVAAFCPNARSPQGELPSTHTCSQRASGSGGAGTVPRYVHAGRARGGGTAFPTRPLPTLGANTPAPTFGPLAQDAGPRRPAYTHPWRGPSERPRARGSPGVSGNREKGHKAKQGANRRLRRRSG